MSSFYGTYDEFERDQQLQLEQMFRNELPSFIEEAIASRYWTILNVDVTFKTLIEDIVENVLFAPNGALDQYAGMNAQDPNQKYDAFHDMFWEEIGNVEGAELRIQDGNLVLGGGLNAKGKIPIPRLIRMAFEEGFEAIEDLGYENELPPAEDPDSSEPVVDDGVNGPRTTDARLGYMWAVIQEQQALIDMLMGSLQRAGINL